MAGRGVYCYVVNSSFICKRSLDSESFNFLYTVFVDSSSKSWFELSTRRSTKTIQRDTNNNKNTKIGRWSKPT